MQLARLDIKITTGMEHTYCTFALCSKSARETVFQSTSQANRKGVSKVNRKGRVMVSDVIYGLAKYIGSDRCSDTFRFFLYLTLSKKKKNEVHDLSLE